MILNKFLLLLLLLARQRVGPISLGIAPRACTILSKLLLLLLVACNLDCPRHPHHHDMQAIVATQDDLRASGGGEATEG